MAAIQLAALADEVTELDSVIVSSKSGAHRKQRNTASAAAPAQTSLLATQPQSIITREFSGQSVAPTAECSRVVNMVLLQ